LEHVIQIGVSVDDEAIQKQVLATAEKKIVGEIKHDIEKAIIEKYRPYYANKVEMNLTERAEEILREWLDENSDRIIECAGKLIAEKVYRSKAWKTKYSEVTEE
jgi:uncharacterized membrane protein YheB (UPF0754 family)